MELLILVVGLVALGFLAARFGHDSRPGFDTPRDMIARDGLVPSDTGQDAPAAPVVAPRRQHRSWLHLPRVAHT
jgi:hypothetical protein